MSEEVIEYEYIYVNKDGSLPDSDDKIIVALSEGEAEYINNFLAKQKSDFQYILLNEFESN
jgi:hypothetical protein